MNIFYLDNDINKCVQFHTDKHIVKMITETAQLLCNTYYYSNQKHLSPYKLSHKSHPCSIWANNSLSNWKWLRDFGIALYEEYMYRYNNKTHKAGNVILSLVEPDIKDIGITKRPQTMPLEYKDINIVKAYRNYYNGAKKHLFTWTKRDVPNWVII